MHLCIVHKDQYHVCKLLKQDATFRRDELLKKEPKKTVTEIVMCTKTHIV